MEKRLAIEALIARQGLLPLFFYKDPDISIEVLKALYTAGIRAVEYTNRGEAALSNFKMMRRVCDNELHSMYLGIGTIKDSTAAQTFIDAGADFIISPGLVEEVVSVAKKAQMLWIPGCMSPSEIIRAEALGAHMIKLFPGSVLGPGFVMTVRDIFPDLLFMPTGGVEMNRDNLHLWFSAGVSAVGMGSKLITTAMLETRDYAAITIAAQTLLASISTIRS